MSGAFAMSERVEKPLVLIVDDQPENIQALAAILSNEVRSLFALNGEQALLKVAEKPIDLILLDVMMPGIDGFTVCERLKQDPATADIPVIFVSGRTEGVDEERGFAVGAVDYVHKPFLPAIVKARVRTHIRLRQLVQQLAAMARTDGLTGLPNRRALDAHFSQEHARALSEGRPLSMLLVDLDHFKQFNDQHGHAVGDSVLRLVSNCLQQQLRSENPHTDDFIGRWGGEEFVLLTARALPAALGLGERLRAAVAALSCEYGAITTSIGVAELRPGEAAHTLFQRADQAIYAAKAEGRNRVLAAEKPLT